ncbi:MAG TPA: DUF5723 family protein [Bacteroidales bacterium]|nr:DUF5723 family protein [Bacteroidales bacterium]
MRKILLFILVITFSLSKGYSQVRLGMTTGEYAGVNSIHLNPANIINSDYYLDIQLAGAGTFVLNNYIYLRNEDHSVFELISGNPDFPTFIDERGNERYVDNWSGQDLKNGYFNTKVFGPSAMLTYGRHGFAFSTGARSLIRVKDFSYDIANYVYEQLDYPDFYNVNYINNIDTHMESVQFAEIALSYNYNVFARNFEKVDVGATAKYLLPYNAAKFYLDNADYLMPNSDTLIIFDMNGSLRSSVPVNFDNNNFPDGSGTFKGSGLGLDIGVVYTRTKSIQRSYERFTRLCRQKKYDYKYRVGLSILDIGYVALNKNVQVHEYVNANTFWPELSDFQFENVTQSLQEISERLLGAPGASLSESNNFSMRLPTAISLQADYHYHRNWYFNSTLIYGFPAKENAFSRPHYASVMPRYEGKYFGAGMPFSLHDFKQPQIGFNIRLLYLTVGTANLAHYMGFSELNGVDLYFTLKFSLLKGNCGRGRTEGCGGFEYGIPSRF